MSPNFALILFVPAWNNPPVKKEKVISNHANAKQRKSMPNENTPHLTFSAFLCALRASAVKFRLSTHLAIQSTLTLPVTYGNSQ
jgi:hypothetical protein